MTAPGREPDPSPPRSWPRSATSPAFVDSSKLVAYLGLDPRVRQSGEQPARSGGISKRGSVSARWGAGRGDLERGRRQPGAAARVLPAESRARAAAMARRSSPPRASSRCCSGACSSRGHDYAHQQPSLTAQKAAAARARRRRPRPQRKALRRVGRPTPEDAPGREAAAAQAQASYRAQRARLAGLGTQEREKRARA